MKLSKMTDEQCLEKFLEFLDERVSITTHFIQKDEGENITHQIMEIRCGEYVTASQPEQLSAVLRVATGQEQGATVN